MNTWTLEYRPYRRRFAAPMRSARDRMEHRQGLLVRLVSPGGQQGYGEVAPLSAYGTEELSEAVAWLQGRHGNLSSSPRMEEVPESMPCTRAAIETALAQIDQPMPRPHYAEAATLLPPGQRALTRLPELIVEGYRTFKWKINVVPPSEEWPAFERLVPALRGRGKLRLDANESLAPILYEGWKSLLRQATDVVEYLEQPLPRSQRSELMRLSRDCPVPVALDESVCRPSDLFSWQSRGWPGLYIIKPSLFGTLASFAEAAIGIPPERVVLSSAFESRIGLSRWHDWLALGWGQHRALGWGGQPWPPNDPLAWPVTGPEIRFDGASRSTFPDLWQSI